MGCVHPATSHTHTSSSSGSGSRTQFLNDANNQRQSVIESVSQWMAFAHLNWTKKFCAHILWGSGEWFIFCTRKHRITGDIDTIWSQANTNIVQKCRCTQEAHARIRRGKKTRVFSRGWWNQQRRRVQRNYKNIYFWCAKMWNETKW